VSAPVITRAQAGLPAFSSLSTSINGTEGVTFHYGGPPNGGFPWSHSRCLTIWKAWDAFHRSKGWVGIAYNYGACIHGFVLEGRGAGYRSAAQGTNAGNATSHAVCYIAGEGEPLTDAAKSALLTARGLCRSHATRGANDRTHDHDDWHSTACPGSPLRDWRAAGLPDPVLAWTPPTAVGAPQLGSPLAAFAATPSGRGYIEVGADGAVHTFGDAMYWGSLTELGLTPNAPLIGAAITPSGGGYWLAGADGGVFCFGDAPYLGGLGGMQLNEPVTEFVRTPSGAGYWMAAKDAGVFTFGDAVFAGAA
jgi:hypothetical protein